MGLYGLHGLHGLYGLYGLFTPCQLRTQGAPSAQNVTAHDKALAALPGYFKKLIGGYEIRAFWFEIFECAKQRRD